MIWALWFGPIIAAVIVAVGIPTGLRIRMRRGRAIERIAERLAFEDSEARGYPDEYDRYLQHYLGRRHWQGTGETRRTIRRWRGASPPKGGDRA